MIRNDVLKTLIPVLGDTLVVCNIGAPRQELHALADRPGNFYMLGTMGLSSSIGLGVALAQDKPVLAIVNDPGHFADLLGSLPAGVEVRANARGRADVAAYFTKSRRDFERRVDSLARLICPDGGLWVCWPKRASKVPTDMTEDVVREVVLPRGLVDVKVAAIDETWSGLRVVHRRENRQS